MTKRIGDIIIFCNEGPGPCQLCGKIEELRPYGPGGKKVCYECAMKDEEEARRQFRKQILGRDENG